MKSLATWALVFLCALVFTFFVGTGQIKTLWLPKINLNGSDLVLTPKCIATQEIQFRPIKCSIAHSLYEIFADSFLGDVSQRSFEFHPFCMIANVSVLVLWIMEAKS